MQKPPSGSAPQAEFAEFMRAYQDMVYSTAIRLTASEPQAEDIAQEVFLKAFAQFDLLKASPSAGGWLKTVATNLSLNHLSRYRKRWRFFSELAHGDEDPLDPMEFLQDPGSLHDDPLDGLDAEHRQRLVERSLAGLPDHQRVPLVLYHFEDMAYQDIATLLGVSIPKLKTDLYRGRIELARRLLKNGLHT